MTIVMGVVPNLFLRPMAPSIERMLAQVRRGAQIRVQQQAPATPATALVQAAQTAVEGRR